MIRWLALLLLLLNVVVFAWRSELRLREAREQPAAPPPLSPNLPGLRLLSELDELPPLREAEPATPVATPLPEPTPGAELAPAIGAEPGAGSATVSTADTTGEAALADSAAETPVTDDEGAGDDGTAAAGDMADAAPMVHEAAPVADAQTATAQPTPSPTPADATTPIATTEAATSQAAAPAEPAAAIRLAATSEVPEAPTFTTRASTGSGVATNACIEVGPFPNGKDADALEAWLAPRASRLVRVNRVMRRRQFFWVYLEPRDAEEARAKLADLRARGVRDFLLIQRGGLKNAISLGLFSTQDAVGRRLAEVTEQGFQPVVVPRIEVTDYDWVRANLAEGYADPAMLPAERLAGAAVTPLDCTQIAAAVPGP